VRPDYTDAAQAFDAVAPGYDAAYGPQGNAVMAWLRRESVVLLRDTFPADSRLLEIGCGTGDEALALARIGHTILATDISPAMAARTQAKLSAAGLADRVTALALPAGSLSALRPLRPFDGAYASFGSLNCEPDLSSVVTALARLLRPGAVFVCSVMARWCPFEIAWFLLHARPQTAFRRLQRNWQPVPVAWGEGMRVEVTVRYLSVGDITGAFTPAFMVERVMSLPLLLPPPYLDSFFRQHRSHFASLEALERWLRQRWPWRRMGDHIALVLRKLE
jgi:SAM-dependent methyltransferase